MSIDELKAIVTALSVRAGISVPRVSVYHGRSPNAFAVWVGHPEIHVSDGMLEQSSYRELVGVLGHEIAHLVSGDSIFIGIIRLVCAAVPVACAIVGAWGVGAVCTMLCLALYVWYVRDSEYHADELGAMLVGSVEGMVAWLLRRGSEPWWSLHPQPKWRVRRLISRLVVN